MTISRTASCALFFSVLASFSANADPAHSPPAGAPPPLVVFFKPGSSTLGAQDKAILDHASRAYNEGKPIVMIITGTADRTGNAATNLTISQKRAGAVLRALLDRGIPADRFQIVAKGETDLSVPTQSGISERRNRRAEISWH